MVAPRTMNQHHGVADFTIQFIIQVHSVCFSNRHAVLFPAVAKFGVKNLWLGHFEWDMQGTNQVGASSLLLLIQTFPVRPDLSSIFVSRDADPLPDNSRRESEVSRLHSNYLQSILAGNTFS